MSEEKRIKKLRVEAWNRAKAEINTVLATHIDGDKVKFDSLMEKMSSFIGAIEKSNLHK